jgi:surface carbohydrate biosynthesis protein
MILCFPIEIKVREFLPKLLLTYSILKKKNVSVILGEKRNLFINYHKSKDLIVFWKGGGSHLINFFKEINKRNYLFNLEEEGPVDKFKAHDIDLKIKKNLLNLFDKNFIWGRSDLIHFKKKNNNTNIYSVFGHPKYDLLKEPYVGIFNSYVNKIKKEYKKFVFIPSSFGTDAYITEENYKIYLYKIYKNNLSVDKAIEAEKMNYLSLIEIIKILAKDNKDIQFVFRPHPSQNIDLVKNSFGKIPNNIKIIYNYSVTPWIIACDLYLHSGCTTVFEAAILKKKIIYYTNQDSYLYYDKFEKIGKFFVNDKKCKDYINLLLKKKINYKYNYNSVVNKVIYNYKKTISFCNNFTNLLQRKYIQRIEPLLVFHDYKEKNFFFYKKILSVIKLVIFKFPLLLKLISFFKSNFVFDSYYKRNKFTFISKNEISYFLNKFSSLENKNYKYKINQIRNNVFKIERV